MSVRPRLALSLGDPGGIGSGLLLAGLPRLHAWADLVVVGAKAGPGLLARGTPPVSWRLDPEPVPPSALCPSGAEAFRLRVLPQAAGQAPEAEALWLDPTPGIQAQDLALGEPSAASGRCAFEAARLAAQLVLAGHADALVTLPLSKAACHLAGHDIPGHTELLREWSGAPITRMAFLSPSLSVVLHTVHQSLRSVIEGLEAGAVAETLGFAAGQFMQLLGRRDLRVALCALNPHAGERGPFGDEEGLLEEARRGVETAFSGSGTPAGHGIAQGLSPFGTGPAPEGWELFPGVPIRPRSAVDGSGLRFFGPLPADSVFHRAVQGEFDLVVALYHDQGLIPLKTLDPTRAVNVTLGLPFIRTSPDHGTAFDKAGLWVADPANFQEACALAVRLAGRAAHQPWRAEVDPRAN